MPLERVLNCWQKPAVVRQVGLRDVHLHQVAECIDRHMHLAASPALVAVVGCARSALAARLQHATIERDHARLPMAHGPWPMRMIERKSKTIASKQSASTPAAILLVDHLPRWDVVGQQTPRCASTKQPAQGVKDFAQAMAAMRRRLFHQRLIRTSEAPFFVADFTSGRTLEGHHRTLASLLLRRSKLRKHSK